MTIYARNGHVAVNISAEGHGGCGQTHSRPVVNGAPAKLWALDCEPCENHLRHDPHWSVTEAEIPETYDETKARERKEKLGKLDRENQLAEAMIELAKLGQLPTAIAQALAAVAGGGPLAVAGQVECPDGHAQAPGVKFCGECGKAMSRPVTAAAITAGTEPAAAQAGGRAKRLRDARLDELQALARQRGLDESGNRAALIARLATAGVTSNDLARLPAAA